MNIVFRLADAVINASVFCVGEVHGHLNRRILHAPTGLRAPSVTCILLWYVRSAAWLELAASC
jgi:hypothetical protein